MLIAILVLTIFNTGLVILLAGVICGILRVDFNTAINTAVKHTDKSIEAATTAIFNMDSIKQKVDMTGRFEL